ncbi:hypothetical protein T11_9292 [Trichinella zimbabwensis]|uniref:Uncharacterized protein n=1 Tax=Trichinella zimbabwensis TaxID=268475 RepID=A0A0V1I470_9BILA|nr:hypothetical protein T11_9292 [Trichinella zimbabwensis]
MTINSLSILNALIKVALCNCIPTLSQGVVFRFSLAFLPVNNNSKSKPFPHNPCPTAPTPHYLYIYL